MREIPSPPNLAYGDAWIRDYMPGQVLAEGRLLPLSLPLGAPPLPDWRIALVNALERSSTPDLVPSVSDWLGTKYSGGAATVIVDDYTRPCAHQRLLLPLLLRWLREKSVPRKRLTILIATATHRDPRPREYLHMFGGDVWPTWRDRMVPHHDGEDLERLGTMPDGTPVELNGRAARSQLVLSLSDLDYHYFAGVSGGPKHLVPGIAGRALTTADHLRMFGEHGFARNVEMGTLDGNPVYEYKRQAVRIVVDALAGKGTLVYAVVCVLNPRQEVCALEGGDILAVHANLRHVLDRVYVARLPRRADVAIVAAKHLGLNVYQAGKAINAAARAVRPGGTILCLAPCTDGFGNEEFRNLMGLAVPILRTAEDRIATGADAAKEGATAIERALRVVQEAVMKDFRIGKQKPVDLLAQYRHTGWGNLWLLCDGLTEGDRRSLPFRYVQAPAADPAARLRGWIEKQESHKPTYVVIDDPTYLIKVDS